ncbi:hypothetical protein Rhopal_004654-T1 [Rhodotorula paludigena]|uniref:Uncharacterized protein n=1 Tax=Rhodotorula paludigena TaxID=86838 RepID=A0AAV5GQ22_9BASI|nr:hypothetical protein Rhopal_004654-T1 [Rhodotorula paludigena]
MTQIGDFGDMFGATGGEAAHEQDEVLDIARQAFHLAAPPGDYSPFRSKTMALLLLLSQLPRTPLSRQQVGLMIDFGMYTGGRDIPTLSQYESALEHITSISHEPKLSQHTGSFGHIFSYKNLSKAIELDLLNPKVSPHLSFYPRRRGASDDVQDHNFMNLKLDPASLTPMVRIRRDGKDNDFFIGEPVLDNRGRYLVPVRWFESNGELFGDVTILKQTDTTLQESEESDEIAVVKLRSFNRDVFRLYSLENEMLPTTSPLRQLAAGKRFVSIPLMIHMDDLGGGRSRKFDPHYAVSIVNAALPRKLRSQSGNIRLFTMASKVSPLEICEALVKSLHTVFNDPLSTILAHSREPILVRMFPLVMPADNVMANELASTRSMAAKMSCRICKVVKTSIADFLQIHEYRSPSQTKEVLKLRLDCAEKNQRGAYDKLAAKHGVRDASSDDAANILFETYVKLRADGKKGAALKSEMSDLRARLEDGVMFNPLLGDPTLPAGFNVNWQTVSDRLHGFALGPGRYLILCLQANLSDDNKDRLRVLLEAAPTNGMEAGEELPAKYLLDHLGSLVGREISLLFQSLVPALAHLVALDQLSKKPNKKLPGILKAFRAGGELMRLLQVPCLPKDDLDQYLDQLEDARLGYIAACAPLMPKSLLSRTKWHLSAHWQEHIRDFGLLSNYATDSFETQNAVYRAASVHSPRTAPSRDICTRIAREEFLRHIVDGGLYRNPKTGELEEPGDGLKNLLSMLPKLRLAMGIGARSESTSSHCFEQPLPQQPHKASYPPADFPLLDRDYGEIVGTMFKVLAAPQDKIRSGDFAIFEFKEEKNWPDGYGFEDYTMDRLEIVRIKSFFKPTTSEGAKLPDPLRLAHAVVEQVRHLGTGEDDVEPSTGMVRLEVTGKVGILPLQGFLCTVNVVHDCVFGECSIDGGGRAMYQERTLLSTTEPALIHTDSPAWLLNNHLHRSGWLAAPLYPVPAPGPTIEQIVLAAEGSDATNEDAMFATAGEDDDEDQGGGGA